MSLYHLLDPEVLANPYPLFQRLRSEDPVHWDPFLHAWVVTRYDDVMDVLLNLFGRPHADAGATRRDGAVVAESHRAGDGQADAVHGRARAHAAARPGLEGIHPGARGAVARRTSRTSSRACSTDSKGKAEMDVIAELAEPLPAIVTAEMLGVPTQRSRSAERHGRRISPRCWEISSTIPNAIRECCRAWRR